jgi:RNase P/RNase MRP subunit p29
MKKKPDIAGFVSTKDPSNFLDGAVADTTERKTTIETRGRKKSIVPKKQKSFHLPLDILEAIEKNSPGNMSVFVETILREYFERNKML